ncbi:MAG: 3'-5' exonuclease [Bacteroidota bacterium]|nr:3'-5' exonuclease [Bacteroidota bacterium]
MELNLSKPLAFFDLETTGTNIVTDRIVEISIFKVMPDNSTSLYTQIVNPTIPIPHSSSKIHGIFDKDVVDKPTFKDIADKINNIFDNCDLAGYNSTRFDIPLLIEEFLRIGKEFDIHNRRFIDVMNIYHRLEPRTLSAAYKFYCDKDLDKAHTAEADTIATYEILKVQLDKYKDTKFLDKDGKEYIPIVNNVRDLHDFSSKTKFVDFAGHIVFNDENIEVFNFGMHKGKSIEKFFRDDHKGANYYAWIMQAEFPAYTKKVITEIYIRSRK